MENHPKNHKYHLKVVKISYFQHIQILNMPNIANFDHSWVIFGIFRVIFHFFPHFWVVLKKYFLTEISIFGGHFYDLGVYLVIFLLFFASSSYIYWKKWFVLKKWMYNVNMPNLANMPNMLNFFYIGHIQILTKSTGSRG